MSLPHIFALPTRALSLSILRLSYVLIVFYCPLLHLKRAVLVRSCAILCANWISACRVCRLRWRKEGKERKCHHGCYPKRCGLQFRSRASAKREGNPHDYYGTTQALLPPFFFFLLYSFHLLLQRSITLTKWGDMQVRNIPNKYNQQMLLDEVNVHHKGTYDFFYLPIDFKNRCNVGYCFINFLEPKFIAPFVEEFNGQRWKSFNSEKICAVTFARIQGKTAMIQRFQNSSLLDKDDEYKPLLFYSSGPDKGKQEPFPAASKRSGLGDSTGAVRSEGSEN